MPPQSTPKLIKRTIDPQVDRMGSVGLSQLLSELNRRVDQLSLLGQIQPEDFAIKPVGPGTRLVRLLDAAKKADASQNVKRFRIVLRELVKNVELEEELLYMDGVV